MGTLQLTFEELIFLWYTLKLTGPEVCELNDSSLASKHNGSKCKLEL